MNAFDRAIAAVSPQWAAKRAHARLALASFERFAYDAAKQGRRTDTWIAGGTGANSEIANALPAIRNRARDLARNNPIATSIVRKLTAKTIGAGIVPRLISTEPGAARRKNAQAIWEAFSDNCDPEGLHDFYGLMNVLARAVFESGEALLRFLPRPAAWKMQVPLQLQVLEGDYLDQSRNRALPDGGAIIQGVQYDQFGRRQGYWLFRQHPGDMWVQITGGLISEFVPADQVLHVFEALRPGQARGVSIFTPVALKLRDIDDYDDAELMRNKIAACFAAFVTRQAGNVGSPLAAATAADTGGINASTRRIERVSPGMIQYLNMGEEVTFGQPSTTAGYIEFVRAQFQLVAAGCGVTYSMATGDLSQANFTQHRAGMIDFWDQLDQWQWLMFIRQAHKPVWKRVFQLAAATGQWELADPAREKWYPPARRMTSPKEETDAERERARSGTVPLISAISATGEDPEEVLEEIALGNKLLDHYGLVLDTDPRKVGRVSASSAPSPGVNPLAPPPDAPIKKTAAEQVVHLHVGENRRRRIVRDADGRMAEIVDSAD